MFGRDSIYNVYEYEHKYKKLLWDSNCQTNKYKDKIEELETKNKDLEKDLEKLKEYVAKLETALANK